MGERGRGHEPPTVAAVRALVDPEVWPVAAGPGRAGRDPRLPVARGREPGLAGSLVPDAHGGLGLDSATHARIVEQPCRGWTSPANAIGGHGDTTEFPIARHDRDAARLPPAPWPADAGGALARPA